MRILVVEDDPGIAAGLQASLRQGGQTVESAGGRLLFEPGEVTTQAGQPFKVFTPFWRACRALPPAGAPLPAPSQWWDVSFAERRAGRNALAAYGDGLTLVFCGTGSPVPDPQRAEACLMVQAGDNLLLIDGGDGGVR